MENETIWFTTPAGGQIGVHYLNCSYKVINRTLVLTITSTGQDHEMCVDANEDVLDAYDVLFG